MGSAITRLSAVRDCTTTRDARSSAVACTTQPVDCSDRAGQPDRTVQDLDQEPRVVRRGRVVRAPFCWRTVPNANSTAARMASDVPTPGESTEVTQPSGVCDITWCMGGREFLTQRAASNLVAVQMDLAGATVEGDTDRVTVLQTLIESGGQILLYRPQLQHYAVLFGDIETAEHVAVVVPGVGDGTNLRDDWIPGARNLYQADPSTAVVLWKGYDNPPDVLEAAAGSIECNDDLGTAAADLTAFVDWLSLDAVQTLTVVAHSFGSIVTGAALADCDLQCHRRRRRREPGHDRR